MDLNPSFTGSPEFGFRGPKFRTINYNDGTNNTRDPCVKKESQTIKEGSLTFTRILSREDTRFVDPLRRRPITGNKSVGVGRNNHLSRNVTQRTERFLGPP